MKNTLIIWLLLVMGCNGKRSEFVLSDENMKSTINPGATVSYKQVEKIIKNDIIVFREPESNGLTCLRVIGLPGDQVRIIKGQILVNNQELERAATSNMLYTVYCKDPNRLKFFKKFQFKQAEQNYGMVSLSRSEFANVIKNRFADSIYELGADSLYVYPDIIKTTESKYFNHYYFGPINIPRIGDYIKKGDMALLSAFRKDLEEDFKVSESYFFCLGDNFLGAMDSRLMGLIPESRIIGKVVSIKNAVNVNVNVN